MERTIVIGPGPGLGCVGLPRGGDSGPGSFSPQGKKRLSCDQFLSSEIGDSISAKPVTEGMQGEVQSSADLLQAACCRRSVAVWGEREGLRTQISPMKGTSLGSHRKTRGLSEGTSIGGVGILSRPKYSWVAGRTGFGPIYSGKTMGLSFSDSVVAPSSNELLTGLSPAVPETGMDTSIHAEVSKGGAGTPAMTAVSQPNTQVTLDSVGFSLPDTVSPVGTEKIDGVDSMILCSLLGNGLQDEVVSENGLEESFVEDLAAESGNELRSLGSLGELPPVLIEERAASPIVERMDLAEEVGGIIGLTCDGQEGLKRECYKQIIVDNMGRGEDSLGTTAQQEAENIRRERGNCSDYEA
jgi:hypothetical protein